MIETAATGKDNNRLEGVAMEIEATDYERRRLRGIVGFFTRLVVDMADSVAMVWDWLWGRFNWSPTRLIIALLLGGIYLVSPIDIVPDVIPLAGWIDDIMVATAVFRLARADLERWRRWKRRSIS